MSIRNRVSSKMATNLLFICTKNQLRSLTAEHIFKNKPGLAVRSAGTSSDARHTVGGSDISWAQLIFVMEKKHAEIIRVKFPRQTQDKEIICLNIPDQFQYMDPDLVAMLEEEVEKTLKMGR